MIKLPYKNFLKARDFIHANGDDVTRACGDWVAHTGLLCLYIAI